MKFGQILITFYVSPECAQEKKHPKTHTTWKAENLSSGLDPYILVAQSQGGVKSRPWVKTAVPIAGHLGLGISAFS